MLLVDVDMVDVTLALTELVGEKLVDIEMVGVMLMEVEIVGVMLMVGEMVGVTLGVGADTPTAISDKSNRSVVAYTTARCTSHAITLFPCCNDPFTLMFVYG